MVSWNVVAKLNQCSNPNGVSQVKTETLVDKCCAGLVLDGTRIGERLPTQVISGMGLNLCSSFKTD